LEIDPEEGDEGPAWTVGPVEKRKEFCDIRGVAGNVRVVEYELPVV